MKTMTKNNITSCIGFLFLIAGLAVVFLVEVNTILLMLSCVVVGLGLVFYKSQLYEYLINKLK